MGQLKPPLPLHVRRPWIVPIRFNLIHVQKFIQRQLIHRCRYCFINNTKELRVLVSMCFWVKKGINGRTNQFEKKHCIWAQTSVFVSSPQPLNHTDNWIVSFYFALFKSRNYGNYVHVHNYGNYVHATKRTETSA